MATGTSIGRRLFSATGLATAAVGIIITGCPQLFPPATDPNATDPNETKTGNSGLTGKYVGSERCMQCHANQHFEWGQTLHAKAYETLENIGQADNENCVGCHVVGFGEPGGFVDRATTNALAGVGCEVCHGPSRDHVENVNDESLHPPINLSASLCGQCHTGSHHPTFEEWNEAGHARIEEHVAEGLVAGSRVNACGQCHSGETFFRVVVENSQLAEDTFLGQDPEELIAITCVVCHDPHERTGNATDPGDGRDFQLRFAETVQTVPTNTIDAATDPSRFNLCGQCHHSRGRDWTADSRGPHHSVQANFYVGEMPTPPPAGADDDDPVPIVPSMNMKHIEASEQCATCHMYRQDFMDEQAPAIAGHDFQVNYAGCVESGCHNSADAIKTRHDTRKIEVAGRIEDIKARLGDPATWQYTAEGGPEDQSGLSDNIRKIRFLISYFEADGSSGTHNTDYADAILEEAERLLDVEGL